VRFLFGFPFALLFLTAVLATTHAALPAINPDFALWILVGALTQIGGTALMLQAMERRSFVVVTAYLKTEPVLVALMGLAFLADPLTAAMALAISLAMMGVATVSVKPGTLAGGMRPAFQGLAAAALFAASAIGYRGAILSLKGGFVLTATLSLAAGLTLQTVLLLAWLLLFDRNTLAALARLWKPSLAAGFTGAAASQCWFLAFALATAASVRTLALVEVAFAQGGEPLCLQAEDYGARSGRHRPPACGRGADCVGQSKKLSGNS
jgi:drug/metabolite transporter (DMT)-like permease